jgi:hypothetical protein
MPSYQSFSITPALLAANCPNIQKPSGLGVLLNIQYSRLDPLRDGLHSRQCWSDPDALLLETAEGYMPAVTGSHNGSVILPENKPVKTQMKNFIDSKPEC